MKTKPKTDEEKSATLKRATEVRDISVEVYKRRLVDGSGEGAVERMLAKDNDGGKMLRDRAWSYDVLTRAYLAVLPERNPGNMPNKAK